MKIVKLIIILAVGLTLSACGRSKQTQFYLLNPIPPRIVSANHDYFKLGIDAIRTPAFTEKSQLMIYDGLNRVQLEEFHQWAEALDRNIKGVIKANLNTLLPRAIIEDAPWSIEFKPDYTLQIDISEFKIDVLGNSSLRAIYLVSYQGKIIKKYEKFYHLKLPVISVDTLVMSMNTNLNHFTQDIAKTCCHLSHRLE